MASEPFFNCIQIHYFNSYKTLFWRYDKSYKGMVVLSIKARLPQAVLNEIPFKKRQNCEPLSKTVDGKYDY